jgi:hypothetical protein
MAVVLLLPILGVAAGLLLMILKILFFAGIVLFVWLVYRYLNGRSPSAA